MKGIRGADKHVRRHVASQKLLVSHHTFKLREDGIGGRPAAGRSIISITGVKMHSGANLLQMIEANSSTRFGLGGAQCWQQKCRKDCYDGNDHQQFKQRESVQQLEFSRHTSWTARRGMAHTAAGRTGRDDFHGLPRRPRHPLLIISAIRRV
jgi:hypothetical protein